MEKAKTTEPVETPEVIDKKPSKMTQAEWDKDPAKHTKDILDSKPKTNFIVPLAEGELPGAYETVQINGHKYTIQKGVMVSIPMPVANLLAEKYRIGMIAGQELSLIHI